MAVNDTTTKRLDRIESKLDQLTDAMICMARAEEKIIGLQDDYNTHQERLNRFSVKLDEIQKTVDDNHRTICVINKVFWVVTVTVIGSVIAQLGVFS